MYAIRHKKTKKFVYGTDRRQFYSQTRTFKQLTSDERVIIYEYKEVAEMDIKSRRMSKDYEVVEVEITVIE